MNSKRAFTILAICLLLAVVVVVPFGAKAQGPNLLKNPGFEEGHHHQDNITEIVVPDGWRMHWSNREPNIFGGYAETHRPETVAWFIKDAPLDEQDLFWRDGSYTVKIFKGWAPVWAAMSQDVSGLEVGRRYRLVAPVYVDIIADYGEGGKIPPQDGRQGRVRLGASPVGVAWRDEANINYSAWWTGESISPFYLTYNTYIHEFTATAPDMTVWIEMAGNYPHPNNGFFIDTVGLYALDDVDQSVAAGAPASQPSGDAGAAAVQPAGPTATPLPTPTPRADGAVVHIVQPGDSFWTLAATYADVMGITPQEALTAIPELNNNPSVIRSGMELIIVPPSENGGQSAADGEETTENTEVEATPEGEAAATEEGVATEEGQAPGSESGQSITTDENSESTVAGVLPQVAPSSICVQVFEDTNGDGRRAQEGEPPMADQAVTLSRAGNTVTTYISDGSTDLHCFEDLEPDTYQVQIFPTADYIVTGDDSWAVAVAGGVMIPVSFGMQMAPDEIAAAGDQAAVAGDSADAAQAANPDSGLSSNMGLIVLGVAAVLVLLLGVGVYLLRRG